MRTDYRIILLSFSFGAGFWILDTLIHYSYFNPDKNTVIELFISDVAGPRLFMRVAVTFLFVFFGFILIKNLRELKKSQNKLQNILHSVIPICITNETFDIIGTNESYDKIFGSVNRLTTPIKCYDERPGPKCHTDDCPHNIIFEQDKKVFTCETMKQGTNGADRHFIVTATPYRDLDGKKTGMIETFQDITPRKTLEKEKEKLISSLQEALKKVQVLSGFLPICASCKMIRDDKGYWTQIETYIRDHSEAEFSHGICPDCAEKYYDDLKQSSGKK